MLQLMILIAFTTTIVINLKNQSAKMKKTGSDKYTALRVDNGFRVAGYYVFSRGKHYILESYNDNGYDERWETSEWIEVKEESVINFRAKELETVLTTIKDNVLVNYKKDNTMYNLAYNTLKN